MSIFANFTLQMSKLGHEGGMLRGPTLTRDMTKIVRIKMEDSLPPQLVFGGRLRPSQNS